MVTSEQLSSYIAGERARGVSDEAIRQELIAKGWRPDDVASALGISLRPVKFSFKNLFQGRINRMEYFIGSIIFISVAFLVFFVLSFMVNYYYYYFIIPLIIVVIAINILGFIFTFSLGIRRLHDIGLSGWFSLLFFIPLANLLLVLSFLFIRGKNGPNAYGPEPGRRDYFQALLNI